MKEEIAKIENRLAELKALAEKNAAEREASGCYDDELLAECMGVLEYLTSHYERYWRAEDWDKFQRAHRLVQRLAKRLKRKAYEGFGS